jgi:hypothetical protein
MRNREFENSLEKKTHLLRQHVSSGNQCLKVLMGYNKDNPQMIMGGILL